MALLFMDGFDAGDFSKKWSVNGGSTSSSTRFGTGLCIDLWAGGSGATMTKTFPAASQIFIGFASAPGSNNPTIMYLYGDTGATNHLILKLENATTLGLYRGGTQLATGTVTSFLIMPWQYIELSATISDAGGTCEVRVNGTTVINFTGDTKNGGTNTTIDKIALYPNYTYYHIYYDDMYILDGTGGAPYNNFLGDVRIHTLVPDAAGSSTQMTPSSGANYTTVDELPYSASDYVTGSMGQKDLYSTSDLPANPGTIYGVQANIISKKTDAGSISGRTVLKSGSTTTPGSTNNLGTSDVTYSSTYAQNPDTAADWSASDVNSIEIGTEAL